MSAPTSNGGKPNVKPIPYSAPQGPRGIMDKGVASGHVEPRHGMAGETLNEMPGQEFTGSPGIGGTNYGNCGSQQK